jgi:hypothetical protein
MSFYYDPDGNPITIERWVELRSDPDSHIVGKTDAWDDGRAIVSTVWLGINHNFRGEGPPIIFETLVFFEDGNQDIMYRYATLEDAKAGHETIVADLQNIGALVRELLPENLELD